MNFVWLTLFAFSCSLSSGCIVPSIPFGKVVHTDGSVVEVGQDYESFDSVTVQCDLGYAIILVRDSDNKIQCNLDNNWNKKFPSCQKICKGSDLVDFSSFAAKCTLNDKSVTCGENFEIGTTVLVQCKPRYELKHVFGIPNVLTCRSDGKWNYSTFKCEPICGVQTPKAQQFIVQGHEANITEAPWNVAIYKTSGFGKELICGGTIITERIVISASHCFYVENENGVTLSPVSSFQVVAGKFYRDFLKEEIFKTQTFGISKIESDPQYKGLYGSNKGDISIVVLNGLIKYELHIAPICMKYSDQRNLVRGSKGWVFGWGNTESGGSPSDTLKSIEVPYVRYSTCRRQSDPSFLTFITDDKLCLGYRDGISGVCRGDSGEGLVFYEEYNGKSAFYLRGIVSIGPKNIGGCDLGFYTLYTNVHKYIPMIQNATIRYPSSYEEIDKTDKKCQIIEMIGHTIETTCSMNDEDLPCPNQAAPGVIAKTHCKLGFNVADSKSTVRSKCLEDGTWDRAAVVCLPKCGVFKTPFALPGANKTSSVLPWHVIIYKESKYICSGTIITDKLVLSAARCFYLGYPYRDQPVPIELLTVAVGKSYRELTAIEPFPTQTFGVEEYYRYLGYYEGDIIFLALKKKILFNERIIPICVDYKKMQRSSLPMGETGKITAVTESCETNEVLNTIDFQVKSTDDCTEEARKLLISPGKFTVKECDCNSLNISFVEKFCGKPKESRVCTGKNIGTSLVFPTTIFGLTSYYLTGIVSIDNSENLYTFFTNSYVYSTFLEDTIKKQIQKNEVYDCPRNEIVGHNFETMCLINDEDVPCPAKILPNTIAKTKCKLGFKPVQSKSPKRSKCMENGNWDQAAVSCLPECGLIENDGIRNGINVPWNVGIYKNDVLECGGTILSEKIVISTAHCFHRETSQGAQLENISDFKIVAGKNHRDLNVVDALPTQTMQIENVRLIEGYSGARGKYNEDMALVILKSEIMFRDYIMPICIDYDTKLSTHPLNDIGKIAGWSLTTPKGKLTDELQMFEIPVVSYNECINVTGFDSTLITNDKFCAGQRDKAGVCNAISGSALVLPKEVGGVTAHYLRGVVSNVNFVTTGCNTFSFTIFTNIHIYLGLIESILNEF